MDSFRMHQGMKYIIYGAGGNCHHIKKLFHGEAYSIAAILDRRAEEIDHIGETPVYSLEQFAGMDNDKEESIVIISVKNVFGHIDIVRELLALGYRNIIYKPFPSLQGEHDEEWDSINDAYEAIVEEEVLLGLIGKQIACSREDHLLIFKDELLIEDGSDGVLCWMPAELMCNYDREDAYGLMPMAAYYPLLNIYQYLLNLGFTYEWEEIVNDFLLYSSDWVERSNNKWSDGLKTSMISARLSVFEEMQKKADIDKNFFVRNAVSVKRIESIRFYLTTSGRNRVSFLIAKGHRFVPVHMSKEDYDSWLNRHNFEKLRNYLEKEHIKRLFTTIPHPLMISYASETTDYVPLFCMPVVREIYRQLHWRAAEKTDDYYKINRVRYNDEKAGLKIVTAMNDEGCIGRLLIMYGMRCYRVYSDKKQEEVGRLIDGLFYIKDDDSVMSEHSMDMIQECRMLIADSRMIHLFTADFCGEVIFLLQWGEEGEPSGLPDGFQDKRCLFRTIWQQEKVSGWMLKKL